MSNNPYGKYVEGVDLLASLEQTPKRIQALIRGWPREAFDRSYAPGKWTARQLLVHLAQAEVVFGDRIRFALTTPGFVVIPFDQDDWMKMENAVDAQSGLAAYLGMRQMNLAFFRSLTPAQRAQTFTHPERGEISVDWIMTAMAGHERHHLQHFELIAGAAAV
jgi:hypothetical protein